jgi:hypothetical protein
MVRLYVADAEKGAPAPDVESVTVTVKLTVPLEVGVPESTPVLVEKDKPVGMDPELIDIP